MYTFTDTYAEERNGQPKLGLEQLKAGTSFRRFLIGYLQTVNNLKFALQDIKNYQRPATDLNRTVKYLCLFRGNILICLRMPYFLTSPCPNLICQYIFKLVKF